MDCATFDRWLNEGQASAQAVDAAAHARTCPECAMALDAEETLDSLLKQRFATTSEQFTDNVLARVATEGTTRPVFANLELAFPWWMRALLEPKVTISCLLGILLVVTEWMLGDAMLTAISGLRESVGASAATLLARPLGLIPALGVLFLGASLLYRLAERIGDVRPGGGECGRERLHRTHDFISI